MNFDMTHPCENCPFRKDVKPYVRADVAERIVDDIEHKTFQCHKTAHAGQKRDTRGRFAKKVEQHCAGALIIMAKIGKFGDMQQVAERLGLFDPEQLRMDAPTYESFDDMLDAYRREEPCPTAPARTARTEKSQRRVPNFLLKRSRES